ncbi:7TM diverse intracellular signaling domain-containing protein [Pararcticibacter amylolyticus]|uniref:Chromosome partitioning protein ParA n=1 Tax=Pararcticibacter amylolyticus TaxID=2173175 RepID=A0A2U2PH95_9SPHI|nr:7TM diverse intracellular signaling domain-containing protein [Pararcticibacter amylolyticus]PWG80499.1 chromosome partitioning protein ParA [Pararcticibacter amylolyticus]
MGREFYSRLLFLFLCTLTAPVTVSAAREVGIGGNTDEHIFTYSEIDYIEDRSGELTFADVRGKYKDKFVSGDRNYPRNTSVSSAYWFRVNVRYQRTSGKRYILEFYNHTTDNLEVYIPDGKGNYQIFKAGDKNNFKKRFFRHKNFEFPVPELKGSYIIYFRLKSAPVANVIVAHRSLQRFVEYALSEYICFGLFYGMILIFSFYNLLMFIAIRKRYYIYYILYLLSVGLYEMSTDGIAFQYLWPGSPEWSQYAYGVPLFFISVFSLLFAADLLNIKTHAPKVYSLVRIVLCVRLVFFLLCLFYRQEWFNYRAIEFIPLSIAFFTGVYLWRKGYHAARFFVLAYAFLFIGFIGKLLVSFEYARFIPGPVPHYSMSLGFILEMLFLSFAIGDKVRLLKKKKEKVQQRVIRQMEENARLKDSMTRDLEIKVEERTQEIIKQTHEIREQSQLIEVQNEKLITANSLLKAQAEEIARMNALLRKDNQELQTSIQKVTHDRIMSAEVDFEEFSKTYPDRETCYSLLADIKWKGGYVCRRCGNTNYCNGHLPFSRRCSKCRYEESVIANTILQNTRIPANKALYMVYLIYTSKGKISSHKLSEITGIRQSTCWSYCTKIKKVLEERKRDLRNAGAEGWSKLMV